MLIYLNVCPYFLVFDGCEILESGVRSDLESVLIAMLESIFATKIFGNGSSFHQDTVNVFLNAGTFSKNEGCNEESMSFEDFKGWCALIPSARKFLGSLLMPPDPGPLLFFSYLCPLTGCPV